MFDLAFPCAYPATGAMGRFRVQADDFQVEEDLGFALTGHGEHLCLHVEKRGQNTLWVAKQLAQWAGIELKDVGYCGLKDRHAVTRQWFSLYLGKRELDTALLAIEGCSLLAASLHDRKLRAGMHRGNHFVIRLRDVSGDKQALSARVQLIAEKGVPNYFGEQRFGIDGANLQQALAMRDVHARIWRERKHQFVVSAVRAWLFNQILAARISRADWQTCLAGECMALPSGPLWGRGRTPVAGEQLALENDVLAAFTDWRDKLEHLGLQQERRALCLQPLQCSEEWHGSDWVLRFWLPPGCYATAVLRECLTLHRG